MSKAFKTLKEIELDIIVKSGLIQQLKLKVAKLEDIITRLNNYVRNNYQYVDDVMKQYFDKMLNIINERSDKE